MLILHHANIITMDPGKPRAGLVAMEGQTIFAVGGNSLLEEISRPGSRAIDCEGKTVIPGFGDAHCHVLAFARSLLSLDCSPFAVRSIADIKSKVAQRAAETRPGTWISCSGYNEFHLAERRQPTRRDLDEAAPNHPVKLGHFSGHVSVLNSAALKAAGISSTTPEPAGAVIEREPETGEPNGVLYEMNYVVDRAMPPPTSSQFEEALAKANRAYLSYGITSLQDATFDNSPSRFRAFRRLQRRGTLRCRLAMMAGSGCLSRFQRQGLRPNSGDAWLRVGAVKIMVTESTGSVFPSQEGLDRLVLGVHRDGGQVAIHAIEETSIEAAVTAIERAVKAIPRPGHRHRIEHCSQCTPALLRRIKDAGITIVTQPPFLYYGGDRYLVQVPRQQQPWLYRIGSFWRAGIPTAASSDSPVVPGNPLIGMCAAATRKSSGGQFVLRDEAISPEQSLAMYTRNAAYASFEEEAKGSIAAGKLADLAVLSADPTAVPPDEIRYIKVERTILGGEVAWEQ